MSDQLVSWVELGVGVITALAVVTMITLQLWTSLSDDDRVRKPRFRK